MSIPIQQYSFHCRFTTEARLPGYLGSTLRGGLGWALKKTACALRRQQCTDCLLREQCGYAWIFETDGYTPGNSGPVNARPHPFVLQPRQMDGSDILALDSFAFDLHLFGRGNEFLPQLVYAVTLMGESGIGTGRRQGLGRFVLERVTSPDREVYNNDEQVLHRPEPRQLSLEPAADRAEIVSVTLQTPLRLKRKNRLQQELPFIELIRAALRRISALEQAYGGGEPDLDYSGMIRRAGAVTTKNNGIRWQRLFRWSNRQKKKISLSGLAGTSVYQGNLDEFLPVLAYAEQVNIGKQTVFGLGKMQLNVPGKIT